MKTIREICDSNFGGNWKLIETLEAREKERDEAERERVKAVSESWIEAVIKGHKVISLKSLMDNIYPPPEPEPKKLPAGYWWVRRNGPGHEWVCTSYSFEFVPSCGFEYRRWDNPPSEVTGKQVALKSVCCDRHVDNMAYDCPKEKAEQQLPTAQEWIEENVDGWDGPEHCWWKASVYLNHVRKNVPDDIFEKLRAVTMSSNAVVYRSHDEALADLKRVLIEMGLAR